jgi:hypothetical protein
MDDFVGKFNDTFSPAAKRPPDNASLNGWQYVCGEVLDDGAIRQHMMHN